MAEIVKIRASVFIGGMNWLPPRETPETREIHEYAADGRWFTANAVNTGRSRVEQEVTVDFMKRKLFTFANTGVTTLRVTEADGSQYLKEGKAATDGIVVKEESWSIHEVSFVMRASARNPLRLDAPTVDYEVNATVQENGTIQVSGSHDGFPCYEFYKQVDFGEFELIYVHNFHETGDTPAAMSGDMEYHFEKTC
ncbi:DUF3238 domain-containing protein [Alicyclobacillus sp. SO9]|uniref:DUF3238 domain-containing protein n=1 Tax=Alicyclobacillus sp. SO9 TaxID=2665646 RepID=UPI0018E8C044|nr:DUF3238 domain-containing protein [Alicyclobacillus sp. SO9]QQE78712.1 DUF3238 domain-containing protein [Alicyclobacillus sp. SO9]